MTISTTKIKKHTMALKNNVFFNKKKWPHFDLLFEDITNLSRATKSKKVVILERTGLYGDISLFAPFFSNKNEVISIDCSTKRLKRRGDYNSSLIKKDDIIRINNNFTSSYKKINLRKNSADLIIVPNLLHHIDDIDLFLKEVKRILNLNGTLYLFEPLVRELHQIPEDFIRYTPYGLESKLKKLKFRKIEINYCGGPFSVIAYSWDQALQYLPSKLRSKYSKWFYQNEYKKLIKLDNKYKTNKIRLNSKFPMSFSLKFKKI